MRYTILINAVKCQEWDLTLSQGALFDLLNQAHTWAKHMDVNGELFFWVSRNMIINEIPLAYSKPDTVYRAFKTLSDKGLIVHAKRGQKDLVRLTEKGKEWNAKNSDLNPNVGNKSEIQPKAKQKNSEINPTFEEKLGNKSEKIAKNSEINPTNKLTINPLTINPITKVNVPFDDFWNLYDKKVGDKEKIKTKWEKLKDSEREAIMNHLPLYKKSQPNKKYRKDPSTYLNNKSWNDEIIFDDGQQPVSHDHTEQAAAPVFDEVALKTDPKVLAMIAAKRKGGSHGTA